MLLRAVDRGRACSTGCFFAEQCEPPMAHYPTTALALAQALWLLPRWLAGRAFRTLSSFAVAAANHSCGHPPFAPSSIAWSWFIPCYWSARYCNSLPSDALAARNTGGLRVRFHPSFNGTVPIHAHGGISYLQGCPVPHATIPARGSVRDVVASDSKLYCRPWTREHVMWDSVGMSSFVAARRRQTPDPPALTPQQRIRCDHCMACAP